MFGEWVVQDIEPERTLDDYTGRIPQTEIDPSVNPLFGLANWLADIGSNPFAMVGIGAFLLVLLLGIFFIFLGGGSRLLAGLLGKKGGVGGEDS